jgi:coproporphyrinogen III oxidase-like Fe-S oxidoreductase
MRTSKRRSPKDFLNPEKSFIDNTRVVTNQDLPLEFMMNAMRLKQGVPLESFYSRTGILNKEIETAIERCQQRDLIELDHGAIKPSTTGFVFLNEILNEFLPEKFPNLHSPEKILFKEVD